KRRLVLGVLLCATLATTVWLNQQDNGLPEVVTLAKFEPVPNQTHLQPSAKPLELDLQILQSRIALKEAGKDIDIKTDLFAARTWNPPPPPPQLTSASPSNEAPKPVAPAAPALPFTYMGKMENNGRLTVYLTAGEGAYSVSVGDTIEDTYRVEKIEA